MLSRLKGIETAIVYHPLTYSIHNCSRTLIQQTDPLYQFIPSVRQAVCRDPFSNAGRFAGCARTQENNLLLTRCSGGKMQRVSARIHSAVLNRTPQTLSSRSKTVRFFSCPLFSSLIDCLTVLGRGGYPTYTPCIRLPQNRVADTTLLSS